MSAVFLPRAGGRSGGVVERLRSLRPQLNVESLALLASVYFTFASNRTFFHAAAATGAFAGTPGALNFAALFVAITALHTLLLCLLLTRWSAKPVLTLLLLVNAAAAHYMQAYTVYLDADMVRNILHTDGKESGELLSPGMLWSLLAYGVLPAVVVWRLRLRARPWRYAVLIRTVWLVATLLVSAAAILSAFQGISSLMRNHRELRYLITPGNYLVSLATVARDAHKGGQQPRMPVGTDARVAGRSPLARPRLLVLVVGETVRAQNWGLNGYSRQTTPQLARIAPINFPQMRACGSSTEVSLPCMFSPYGRAHYDADRIKHSESLLHVLEHAGIATLWRDNQTGCKGVCEGLAFESFEHATVPGDCTNKGCLDQVLLHGLADRIRANAGDVVVVLHQLGNHGPAYYRRYPARQRVYLPACETPELEKCSRAEIVNAYDNAVRYTDEFLARTIDFLRNQSGRDTAMIYLSDHGESLGENGLYLHGVPYAIAPETQTRVPMVMWLSPAFVASRGIDMGCLTRRSAQPASQDNLFHSVLGLMQVHTQEYDPMLDLFASCESGVAQASAASPGDVQAAVSPQA